MPENGFTGDASNYAEGDGMLDLSQERRAFIEEVAYYANQEYSRRKAAGEDWVLPSVCVSQACLESGYGDVTTVNIFGIKGEGTTTVTSEEYTPGVHTTITDSFVSHGTIADDVKVYYDLICGTGEYEGWDIYSAARNNEDAEDAIRKIREAGYATSSTYSDDVISILNQYNLRQFDTGMVDLEYHEEGYQAGVEANEALMKIVEEMNTSIETCEGNLKNACSKKPQVEYQSIVKIEEMKSIVKTLKELLEKTKMIADEEKYIAEHYSEEGGEGSLSTFQAAAMATAIQNYAFDDFNDFKTMVGEYQKSSNEVFSKWFEGYVTNNGIESKVVNMSQYMQAVKETGAAVSSDYVVSKVTFALAKGKEEEGEKAQEEETGNKKKASGTTSTGSNSGGSQFRYSGGVGSTGAVVSGAAIAAAPKVADAIKKTEEKTSEEKEKDVISEDESKKKVYPKKEEETVKKEETTKEETPVVQEQNEVVTTQPEQVSEQPVAQYTQVQTTYQAPKAAPQQPAEVSYQAEQPEALETIPEEVPTEEIENKPISESIRSGDEAIDTPTESTITKIPVDPNYPTTPKKSSGSGVVPAVLGLSAAGIAGGGAAYYLHKKHQEEGEEYEDEEEYTEDYSDGESNEIDTTTSDIAVESYSADRARELDGDNYQSEGIPEEDENDNEIVIPKYSELDDM